MAEETPPEEDVTIFRTDVKVGALVADLPPSAVEYDDDSWQEGFPMETVGGWREGPAWRLLVTLLLLVVAAHGLSLLNGHVWDDHLVILRSPERVSFPDLLFSTDFIRRSEPTSFYRPLTLVIFRIEGVLYAFSPFMMHLVNLLLHAGVATLLFHILLGFRLTPVASFAGTLLFATHPMTVETVSFLSGGRNTLLSALFTLASFLAYQRWCGEEKRTLLVWSALLLLLGLFSKESAIGIVPVVAWLEIRRRGVKRGALTLLPFALVLLLYVVLRSIALAHAGQQMTFMTDPLTLARTLGYVIPRIVMNLLLPFWLSPWYFVPGEMGGPIPLLAAGWVVFLLLLAAGWTIARPPARLGIGWALLFWLPTSGLVQFNGAPTADRYLYLSLAGVGMTVAAAVSLLDEKRRLTPRFRFAFFGLVALFTLLSVRQTTFWRTDETLFLRLVSLSPEQPYGYHSLGCYYLDVKKDLPRAEAMFLEALKRDPNFPWLQTQLGNLRFRQNDFGRALFHYELALRRYPYDGEALVKSGQILQMQGDLEGARERYRRFLSSPAIGDYTVFRPFVESRLRMIEMLRGRR